jgi:5-methylcytosine-specific restriction enzyme subunit McrC
MLEARDCSPLNPQPKGVEVEWLKRLAVATRDGANVVSIGAERDEDEPIVHCLPDGTWCAGRYVGSVSFEGSRLTVRPRFGIAALRSWLFHATNVALVESPGVLREDESFIVQLLAAVWARGFVEAARHGLPALRREARFTGPVLRGRLDVQNSIRLIAAGGAAVASVRREKSLEHAASRAIVAAYSVLRRWVSASDDQWLPARARELLPHLIAVTGLRPQVPSRAELDRVRYTPITAGFAPVAELSRQIANRRGLASDSAPDGECQGVLLDVAELWELYVLAVLRRAAGGLAVRHGTRELAATGTLLRSEVDGTTLGALRPDAVVMDRSRTVGVLDAKYKQLHPTALSPNGPQREDIYQLAAYLSHFGGEPVGAWGMLAYPFDPARPEPPFAETRSPWILAPWTRVTFVTLPHDLDPAAAKLRGAIFQTGAHEHLRQGARGA